MREKKPRTLARFANVCTTFPPPGFQIIACHVLVILPGAGVGRPDPDLPKRHGPLSEAGSCCQSREPQVRKSQPATKKQRM